MNARVVVTGAGSGIGRAISECLARDGYVITSVDVVEEDVRRSVAGLEGVGHEVVVGDVANRETHKRAAEISLPLAGWVNCAGVTLTTPLAEPDESVVRRLIEVNQLGSFWGCSAAVGQFLSQGKGGAIVNVTSVHGRQSAEGYGAYEMTKAAIDALTRNVAVAYGSSGIRANAVAPGAVMTPALAAAIDDSPDPAAATAELEGLTPLRRIAHTSEIASVVRFLVSSEASYLSGQSIAVDGGWTVALGVSAQPHGRTR